MTGRTVDLRGHCEANVVLELRMDAPISEEALDDYSEAVMDTLAERASEIVLGPAVVLNAGTSTIALRFDVLGADNAEIHRQVTEVLAIIERDTDLVLARSSVAAQGEIEGTEHIVAGLLPHQARMRLPVGLGSTTAVPATASQLLLF